MSNDVKKFDAEKFLSGVPEQFQEAAAFLITAVPKELEIVDMVFQENKTVRPGGYHYQFDTIVRNPKAKRRMINTFNANKILRQILKEKRYGQKQRINFTI